MKWFWRLRDRARYHRLLDELTAQLQRGDHEHAVATAGTCLELASRGFGSTDPEVVPCLYALASAELAVGRFAEATAASERALAIANATVTTPPLHQLLEQRAAIADRAGDEIAYEAALRRSLEGDEPAARAAAHNRLGLFLGRGERFAEAAEQFDSARAIRESTPGNDLAVAEVLHNSATFRDPVDPRQLERASTAFERALDLSARHLSQEASLLEARIAHNFAVLRQEQLEDEEALALYRRALAAFERDHDPNDAVLRPTLARLGRLLQSKKRFHEAVCILQRAHRIAVAELGEAHDVTGTLALWLGDANSHTFR